MTRSFTILVLILLSVMPSVALDKHALIIGLGKQQDPSWAKINGDKDADYVVKMLQSNSYKDIRILKNEKATKQAIVQAFTDLANACRTGDHVYVHYSGHGQMITDIDGDESKRWKGRHAAYDESWVPYDAYMNYCEKDHGEKHLSDDEVAKYLTIIRNRVGKTGKIIVVIDACHSGDATCGTTDEPVRGVDTPFNIPRQPGTKPSRHYTENWLTISACKPYQLCFEHTTPQMGKLTAALCKMNSKLFSMNNNQIQYVLDKYMEAYPSRLPQNPMVTGKK